MKLNNWGNLMRIYVAGAFGELLIIKHYIKSLKSFGHTITHDWTTNVEKNGGIANLRDASLQSLVTYANEDFDGIKKADVVWFLVPEVQTFGAWVEMGYAYGIQTPVFVSGDWKKSIFTSIAIRRFDSHELALNWFNI